MRLSVDIDMADEGSPARLVDRMCEAGNKKSSYSDVNYNIHTTNYIT